METNLPKLREAQATPFLNFLRGMETAHTPSPTILLATFLNFLRGMETASAKPSTGASSSLPKLP